MSFSAPINPMPPVDEVYLPEDSMAKSMNLVNDPTCCPTTIQGNNGANVGQGGSSVACFRAPCPGGAASGTPSTAGSGAVGGSICCLLGGYCPPPSSSSSSFSAHPIRYANGEIRLVLPDLSSFGLGVPWGHTRTYSNQLSARYAGRNGNNWFVTEWPHIEQVDSTTLCVITSIYNAEWFQLSGSSYTPLFGVQKTLTAPSGSNEFVLTDRTGTKLKFYDFTVTGKAGQFKSYTDEYGHEFLASVGTDGRVLAFEMASAGNTCRYSYVYPDTGDVLLQAVTLAFNGVEVSRCRYEYYAVGETGGSINDLKFAIVDERKEGSWVEVDRSYYRYQADSLLSFIVGRQSWAMLSQQYTDPTSLTNDELEAFADNRFIYDTNTNRVTEERVAGGTRRFLYSYEDRGSAQTDVNEWQTRTIETRPDATIITVYANSIGQVILKAVQENASDAAPKCECNKYQAVTGRLLQHAGPEALLGYQEDNLNNRALLFTWPSHAVLIPAYDYYSATNLSAGAVAGYLFREKIQNAWASPTTEIALRDWLYTGYPTTSPAIFPVWKETVYFCEAGNGTDPATTTYTYDWYSGTFQVMQRTTTWPAVTADRNGTDIAAARAEFFDQQGRMTWLRDERGTLTRFQYDAATDSRRQVIQDVKCANITDEPLVPVGWGKADDNGLHLVTDYTLDARGRVLQELGPKHTIDLNGVSTTIRRARWFIYHDDTHEQWEALGYATRANETSPWDIFTLINPVRITRSDSAGRVTDEIQALRSDPARKLEDTDQFPQTAWVRWAHTEYNAGASPSRLRVYHNIPATGPGGNEVNYAETLLDYDSMLRQNRVVTPGGTITRTVFDHRGRAVATWVGTNDANATEIDPSAGGTNNMLLVQSNAYDESYTDWNWLKLTISRHPDATTTRDTVLRYDWRNRVASKTEADIFKESYDYCNLGRVTVTTRENITTNPAALVWIRKELLDQRAQVYRVVRFSALGEGNPSLTDNFWHEPTGQLIKEQKAGSQAFQKYAYDSMGRVIRRYLAYDFQETEAYQAATVDGDTVLQQEELAYDEAGNLISQVTRERFHNAPATQTGSLTPERL